MNYTPVIGLEVHIELSTKTKMFCRCSADYFGKDPNTLTCPTCLGLPGALPVINKRAIEDVIKIGLALNCQIASTSLFERKNYFYPDLPKGYQISQYRWPLCTEGFLEITNKDGGITKIKINRVHQEEDTGKLAHSDNETLIDFNRSGLPLVEIVTEPDFKNSEEVREYAKKLQQILRSLGVTNADMEKGEMRLEANVSVRPEGQAALPEYRVELKNINSFKFMGDAINYEIKRQTEVLQSGGKITQHTRGWNQIKKETFVQREKEEANDYRYFPEPDLPPLQIEEADVVAIKNALPKLPDEIAKTFESEFGLSTYQSKVLTDNPEFIEYFTKTMKAGAGQNLDAVGVVNLIINKKVDIIATSPEELVKSLVEKKADTGVDEQTLEKWAREVIAENPKVVEEYKNGKINAMQALIGGMMRKSQGKAQVEKIKELLNSLLA